jgi:hypothetical protein
MRFPALSEALMWHIQPAFFDLSTTLKFSLLDGKDLDG